MKAWDDSEWMRHREQIVRSANQRRVRRMQAHPMRALYTLAQVIFIAIAFFTGGFALAVILFGA